MSQKLENLLNLALDADQGERERSEELDVGYDKEENVWELIVKYSGTLEAVRQTARSVTELLNGYAVIVIEEERIGQLAQLPEVEFIEKPKKLYFQTDVFPNRRIHFEELLCLCLYGYWFRQVPPAIYFPNYYQPLSLPYCHGKQSHY